MALIIVTDYEPFNGFRLFVNYLPTTLENMDNCLILEGVSERGECFRFFWVRGKFLLSFNTEREESKDDIKYLRKWCRGNIPFLDCVPGYPDKSVLDERGGEIFGYINTLKIKREELLIAIADTHLKEKVERENDVNQKRIMKYRGMEVELGENFGKYACYRVEFASKQRYTNMMYSTLEFAGPAEICKAFSPEGQTIELFYDQRKNPTSLTMSIHGRKYKLGPGVKVPPNARGLAKKLISFVVERQEYFTKALEESGFKWL
jgi:ribosomal protein L30E